MGYITEHLPLVISDSLGFIILALVFGVLMILPKVKVRLCDLFMLLGLIILTFYSQRQESMFIIIGIFILIRLLDGFLKKYFEELQDRLNNSFAKIVGTTLLIRSNDISLDGYIFPQKRRRIYR